MNFPIHISINYNTQFNCIIIKYYKVCFVKLIVSLLSESHISRCFKVLFISVSSSTTLFAWKVIEVSSANSTK